MTTQQIEAMKLALKAIESEGWCDTEIVITAIKEALAQQPPQRTWVGLTEQDLDYLCNLAYTGDEEFALAVQAKLKDKNT